MFKATYKKETLSKPGFISAIIFSAFYFSCTAQTSVPSLFQPAAGSPIALPCGPGNIVAGDINNDGMPDLVTTCGQTRTVTIFRGRGNGKFDTASGGLHLFPFPPNEVVIADVNNDRNADLVVASHDSYSVLILPGDGRGNFSITDSVTMRVGNHPHTHGLGVADLNRDGYNDIVTANNSDNDISVMLNNARGGFTRAAGSPFTVSPSPYPLTIGDVNNDQHLDIVSTSTSSTTGTLTLLLGDGQGHFSRKDVMMRTASPWFVAIGDLNNDRIPDMVASHSERSEMTVLLGTGSGQFQEVNGSPFNLGSSAWHIALADLNGDGNRDVLAAANNRIQAMLGDGSGKFVAAQGTSVHTGKGTWHLAVNDINGDGRSDVVTSNLESQNVSVFIGK